MILFNLDIRIDVSYGNGYGDGHDGYGGDTWGGGSGQGGGFGAGSSACFGADSGDGFGCGNGNADIFLGPLVFAVPRQRGD